MAKQKTKGNEIPGTFTAISHTLKRSGLDIYEMIIISEVQSWNRQDKKFYGSLSTLAKDYGCDRKVIMRRVEHLMELGILYKGKKVYNNQAEYRVNVTNLMLFIKSNAESSCTSEEQLNAQAVPLRNSSCTSEVHNNKPKNINKNILREVEDVPSSSTPKPEGADLAQFLLDLNK